MSDDTRPVYLRLRDLIAASIIEGRYREGEMLPSVRAFAAEQGASSPPTCSHGPDGRPAARSTNINTWREQTIALAPIVCQFAD